MDRAAASIDDADFVFQTTADGLCERLQPMQIDPVRVLDLGCGTGARRRQISKLYPRSHVFGVDISAAMLARARSRRGWFSHRLDVQGSACALPIAENSVDLVFANMLLPFINDLSRCLDEVARVLQTDGLFVFSTLGPDSLAELRSAWQRVDSDVEHVRAFPDMHVIGDAMLRSRLRDPVLDVDFLEIRYQNMRSLYGDLTATGARNSLANRRRGLTVRRRLQRVEAALSDSTESHSVALKLELVYGHAWGAVVAPSSTEYRFDAARIGRRRD
jgi:malonyl-CoA O-methyltransferase